jgi:hypothetical protein
MPGSSRSPRPHRSKKQKTPSDKSPLGVLNDSLFRVNLHITLRFAGLAVNQFLSPHKRESRRARRCSKQCHPSSQIRHAERP